MVEKHKAAIQYKKGMQVLFEASYRLIPFNVILALLLCPVLLYNKIPWSLVSSWLAVITLVSVIRWIYCRQSLKKGLLNSSTIHSLRLFALLALFMGASWGSIYFISRPYLPGAHEYIILLVFGGMCSGSISSLSVYPTAYYAYLLSMLLPVIVYNFCLMSLEPSILATMTLLFVLILIKESNETEKLLKSTFNLSEEKEFLIDKLEKISITDALTGLYNRRYYNSKLVEEYNRAKRNKHSLALVSVDIDNFKLINDNLGHPYGDKILAYTADLLANTMKRANDTVFRLGGDEFIAILANSSIEDAKAVCEKIHEQFKPEQFSSLDNQSQINKHQETLQKITLSIGVVDVTPESPANVEDIIMQVDRALYQAKNGGKDKIIYVHCK